MRAGDKAAKKRVEVAHYLEDLYSRFSPALASPNNAFEISSYPNCAMVLGFLVGIHIGRKKANSSRALGLL